MITATLHSFRGCKPDISPQKIHETNEEWGWGRRGLGAGGGWGPDNDRQASRAAAAAAFSGPVLVADEGLEVPQGQPVPV